MNRKLPANFTSVKPISFPCLDVRMVDAALVVANDYNPNRVSAPELDLLEISIRADGFTQAIVVFWDPEISKYIVVDGFHRFFVLTERLECRKIPIVEIKRELRRRMTATVQHNQACGHHQVDLMVQIVIKMVGDGWSDERIIEELGMEKEELLRLKQTVGAA